MIKLDRVFKFYRSAGVVKIVLDHVSTRFDSGFSYGLLASTGGQVDRRCASSPARNCRIRAGSPATCASPGRSVSPAASMRR